MREKNSPPRLLYASQKYTNITATWDQHSYIDSTKYSPNTTKYPEKHSGAEVGLKVWCGFSFSLSINFIWLVPMLSAIQLRLAKALNML